MNKDKYVGKRLDGRYEIRELIGNGGMANVYLAYDKLEDRMVALKILKDEYIDNEEFLRRFRNESKAIAVLSHPNIVKVFDVSFGNNIQYIVMEYIDGITLKEYIEQNGKLNWKEAVHFTVQILRALQHAHERGVIHRDIKPQNIMLLEDGTIKVMDFGIASVARDERVKSSDKAIGSVHYISPEQASGATTDERTDIYAVGVMMYEMLTGKLPFEGANPEQIAVMHMQSKAVPPRNLNPEIPEGLEEITMRAMQKDVNMRYQSTVEMLRDIDEFKHNPSIVFEYKYFSDDGTTKFFKAVNSDKSDEDASGDENSAFDDEDKKKSKVIPILAGVASAFVVAAIVFVSIILLNGMGGNSGETIMPNLVGLNYEEIKNDPQYSDFKMNPKTEYSEDKEPGIILEQSVPEGQTIKVGRIVDIKVSIGVKKLEVPDVVNMKYEDAVNELTSRGFLGTPKKTEEYNDTVAAGVVIRTDPAADTSVDPNTQIQIFVSLGKAPEAVKVPALIGKTQKEAEDLLDSVGLKCKVVVVDTTEHPAGKVYQQSMDEGVTVEKGDTITITVSSGKASSSTVNFSASLPSNVAGDYDFIVYLDGVKQSTTTLNVGAVSKFTFKLSGNSKSSEVAVIVSKSGSSDQSTFIRYTVNFTTGKIKQTYKDSSVFAKAVSSAPPASSAPVSSAPPTASSSSAPTAPVDGNTASQLS